MHLNLRKMSVEAVIGADVTPEGIRGSQVYLRQNLTIIPGRPLNQNIFNLKQRLKNMTKK